MNRKVYVASNLKHRSMWIALIAKLQIVTTSRWLIMSESKDDREFRASVWTACIEDVKSADVLLYYKGEGDSMKGALVEIGIALGAGIPIVVCGHGPFDNSFFCHSLVFGAEGTTAEHGMIEACRLAVETS